VVVCALHAWGGGVVQVLSRVFQLLVLQVHAVEALQATVRDWVMAPVWPAGQLMVWDVTGMLVVGQVGVGAGVMEPDV